MLTGSRDLGLDRGRNGKGSANRSDPKLFKARFPKLPGKVDGFERRGRRLVKVYGAQGNEIHLRPVVTSSGAPSSLSNDLKVAQKLADEANAGFRARGIDTRGH